MRIALWTVSFNEQNGQGLITKHVYENVLRPLGMVEKYIFEKGLTCSSLVQWLEASFRLWWRCLFKTHDVLYVVCSRSTFGFIRDLPALVCAVFGQRVVVHAHGGDITSLLAKRRYSSLARFFYRRVCLIVSNDALATECSEFVLDVRVLENYLAHETIVARRLSGEEPFLVFWNSNVMASKGFFTLARAVSHIADSGEDVRMEVIGRLLPDESMSLVQIENEMEQYCQCHWFEYLGPVSQKESISLLSRADVVALLSRSEAQPFCLIEAMCAGTHLIVSDIPSILSTIKDYPACVVEVGDVNATQNALQNLITYKKSHQIKFKCDLRGAAVVAQKRFSKPKFDMSLHNILWGPGNHQKGKLSL